MRFQFYPFGGDAATLFVAGAKLDCIIVAGIN